MMDLAQKARVKQMEFVAGVISVANAVDWADAMLAESDDYDDDLANVSLAAKAYPQDVVGLLRPLAEGADDFEAMRCVMGSMHRILLCDDTRARGFTQVLERFSIDHYYRVPEDMSFIVGVDDELDMAEQGIYGTREEAVKELIEHLSPFDKTANQASDGAA